MFFRWVIFGFYKIKLYLGTYFVYILVYAPGYPNGEQVSMVRLVSLFSTTGTTSEIMAAGVAHISANTHIMSAVKTVIGFVY